MAAWTRRAAVLVAMVGIALAVAHPANARDAGEAEIVPLNGVPGGTIIVRTTERHLYLTLGDGMAIRYPIAVGLPGKEWSGRTYVARMAVNPVWAPPAEVKHDKPELPDYILPGPSNPLGPRALVLAAGQYAIHGTNRPETIGTKASYGCIRMYNRHIVDLYQRVSVGTPVIVER
eukprot:gene23155-24520_t